MQIGEGQSMNFVGCAETANPIEAGERITSIGYQICFKAEIAGHADGCFDGIVGNDAAHDERVEMSSAQGGFEEGADKSTIGLFGNHGFAREGRGEWFEFITRLARPIRGSRFHRIVPNVIDGRVLRAPSRQQIGDVLFCVRIVTLAVFAPRRVVDSGLKV